MLYRVLSTSGLLVFLMVSGLLAQVPDTLWTRAYGGGGYDAAQSIQETHDGGYIVVGDTYSFGAGGRDIWLLKLDADGDTLWSRTYGGADYEYGRCVKQTTPDNGYVITGYTRSFGAGGYDVYLIKTDADGDTLWTKTYGGSGLDYGTSVQQTFDGGYVVAGYSTSFGAGDRNVYLIKTDADGLESWARTTEGLYPATPQEVQQTPDGGYIIAGSADEHGAYLMKTDSLGLAVWQRTYGGAYHYGYAVDQVTDGGYIIAGSLNVGGVRIYLVKTDADGHATWTGEYGAYCGGGSVGQSVRQTADGGYIVAGAIFVYETFSQDLCVMKTNANGDSVWAVSLGGSYGWDMGLSVEQTSDGGYVAAGYLSHSPERNEELCVVRTEGDLSSVYRTDPSENVSLRLTGTPNPSNSHVTFTYELPADLATNLAVYNLLGQEIKTLKKGCERAGIHSVVWDGTDSQGREIPSGIYFCRLLVGDRISSQKIVRIR
jgi:hypothetical protein